MVVVQWATNNISRMVAQRMEANLPPQMRSQNLLWMSALAAKNLYRPVTEIADAMRVSTADIVRGLDEAQNWLVKANANEDAQELLLARMLLKLVDTVVMSVFTSGELVYIDSTFSYLDLDTLPFR